MEKCPKREDKNHCWHVTVYSSTIRTDGTYCENHERCCFCGEMKLNSYKLKEIEPIEHGPFEPSWGTIAVQYTHTEECCPHGTD